MTAADWKELVRAHGATAGVALALILPVWLFSPLALQDLPTHEQLVALMVHGLEFSGLPENMSYDPSPHPYVVVYWVWAALAWIVGVEPASKLLVSYGLVGGFLASATLVRRLDPRKGSRALLVALLAFSEWYYLGFVPMLVALPTAFALLARRLPAIEGGQPRRELMDGALLLVTFLCHPLMALYTCLILGVFALRSAQRRRAVARLFMLGAPCVLWFVVVAVFGRERTLVPDLPLDMAIPWKVAALLLGYPVASHGWIFFWALSGPIRVLAVLSLLAWGVAIGALFGRGPREPAERIPGLGLAVLLLGVGLFVLPHSIRDGSGLSVRGLVFFFPLLLAWAPAWKEEKQQRVLVACAVGLSLLVGAASHYLIAEEARAFEPLIEAMEPGATVLSPNPVQHPSRAVRGWHVQPHMHALLRYHSLKGGLGPTGRLGAGFSRTPVQLHRRLPPWPAPGLYRYIVQAEGPVPEGYREIPVAGPLRLYERR